MLKNALFYFIIISRFVDPVPTSFWIRGRQNVISKSKQKQIRLLTFKILKIVSVTRRFFFRVSKMKIFYFWELDYFDLDNLNSKSELVKKIELRPVQNWKAELAS